METADNIYIDSATRSDIPGIIGVLDGTLGQDFRFGEYSFEENVSHSFLNSLRNRNEGVYVAKDGDEVIGFAWFMNHPPNNGTAILEMFAVRKDKQGKGVGSRLIAETSDMFVESQRNHGINLRTLHLTTNLSNEDAQTIYQRAGYNVAGEIEGFVGRGNIEVVMVKRVSKEPCPEAYRTRD